MKLKINIIILFLLVISNIYGQQTADTHPAPSPDKYRIFDSSLASVQLDTLQGRIRALYSKNYEFRAKSIRAMVGQCCAFYEQKFPEVKFTVQLLILDKKDYSNLSFPFAIPYGLPFSILARNSMVIGADKRAVSELLGPDNTPDTVLSSWDSIALHELGHIFFGVEKNIHTGKNWADEFLANYFAECYLAENIPNYFTDTPIQGNTSGYQPKYKTLEDFERLYLKVGPRNYGWYQGKFEELCDRLYPKLKFTLVREFIANYDDNGKKSDPLALLKQLAPEITDKWLEEMK